MSAAAVDHDFIPPGGTLSRRHVVRELALVADVPPADLSSTCVC
jgi:hypothetical protein